MIGRGAGGNRSTPSTTASARSSRGWPKARATAAIAERMFLSERAVERRITAIFDQLGLRASRQPTAACSPCSPTCAPPDRARHGPARRRRAPRSSPLQRAAARTGGAAGSPRPRSAAIAAKQLSLDPRPIPEPEWRFAEQL